VVRGYAGLLSFKADRGMEFQEVSSKVISELSSVFQKISASQIENFTDAVIKAKSIFTAGTGREVLSSCALAMRLMHLGKTVHWM